MSDELMKGMERAVEGMRRAVELATKYKAILEASAATEAGDGEKLKQWELAIRQDERYYLLKLLEAVKSGECDEEGAAELLEKKPSIMDAMTRGERAKADIEFLKSLGIKPFSA